VPDTAPLIFEQVLGSLRPVNGPATIATKAVQGRCVVKITKMNRNQRRRGFYWVMLDVAAEVLCDKTGRPWDADLLHVTLKDALRLGETWTTPSGRKVFKPRSTSDRAMTEAERSAWVERCKSALSVWCEVEIVQLMDEVRARGFNEEESNDKHNHGSRHR